MNKIIVISLSLFLSTSLFSRDSNSTRETADTILTYAIGVSGGTSLFKCSKVKPSTPVPYSFYAFNSSAIAYSVIDLLIDDEDKKASEEIAARDYGGSADEQMNSYKRSRDLAIANKEAAKEKGTYKLAASAAMMASATLALYEGSVYKAEVKKAEAKTKADCLRSQQDKTVNPGMTYMNERCKNLGGAKVVCSKAEKENLAKMELQCRNLSASMINPLGGCFDIQSKFKTMSEVEKSGKPDITKVTILDHEKITEVNKAAVSGMGSTGLSPKSDFFLVKLLTVGGFQYNPTSRAITYGALSLIMGANTYANNSAAIKFEEEEEYFTDLINGLEDCGDNCHSSGEGDDDEGGDGDDGTNNDSPHKDYDESCASGTPTIDELIFDHCEVKVKGWPVTSTLRITSLTKKMVTLDYDKKDVWPAEGGAVANAFIIYNRNCKWYASSFEWMRPGQSQKFTENFKIGQGVGSGERIGFMVTGRVRRCVNVNHPERTNIVMTRFP